MFDTILVPLDGRGPAETALPYALAEARAHQADLVLIHVIVRPEVGGPTGQRGGPTPREPDWCDDQLETATSDAHAYLRDVVNRHALPATTTLRVTAGDPVHRISDEASEHPNCLLVMTTGNLAPRPELSGSLRSTSSRATLSNVFQRLSAQGTTPILSINPAALPLERAPAKPARDPRTPAD
jgi:nucleotide-binding universal stress UspA family protein